jgi:hypothetical protein
MFIIYALALLQSKFPEFRTERLIISLASEWQNVTKQRFYKHYNSIPNTNSNPNHNPNPNLILLQVCF